MQWVTLLDRHRLNDEVYREQPNRPTYVQDADRILFSAPFRRLANKTQVHPLYEHDHLHHRLIHSVETASVGRSLGMEIGHWLEEGGEIAEGERHAVAGIIHAACLAHDIGNPPFGHSGEAAIGDWFAARFAEPKGLFAEMDKGLRGEFEAFEGNAQGFRLLTRLEMYRNEGGMRLSHGVLGAFSKYPVTQRVQAGLAKGYCGTKKFGVFASELDLFAEMAGAVGLPEETSPDGGRWWRRHPLVFVVEAADDICYNIIDMEDAFTAGDVGFEEAKGYLEAVRGRPAPPGEGRSEEETIALLRALAIGEGIAAAAEAFKTHYAEIMAGRFSSSLIEASDKAEAFAAIKTLMNTKIFRARRKTELEVSGRNMLWSVLDGIMPVYQELSEKGWDASRLTGYRDQLVRALDLDLRDLHDAYGAFHSLADFASGMTDRAAVKTAGLLGGNLPLAGAR